MFAILELLRASFHEDFHGCFKLKRGWTALEEFEHDIGSFKEVRSCYHLTGISDYMLEINVPDMDHYHRFITRKLAALDNIAQVKSMFVMNEIIEK